MDPEHVLKLTTCGTVELTGHHARQANRAFDQLNIVITPQIIDKIPTDVGVVGRRFDPTSIARRRGIYYVPMIHRYLPDHVKQITGTAYNTLTNIARDWLATICARYSISMDTLRGSLCVDVMTLARYEEAANQMAVIEHTDPNLLTVCMSDHPGFEILQDGEWQRLPANTPYIHVGTQLQRFLKQEGCENVQSPMRRVYSCEKNSFSVELSYVMM